MGMIMDDASGTILADVTLLPIANEIGVSAMNIAAIVGVNVGLGSVMPHIATFV
ncbi:MAG: hypothetical protein V3V88_00380 [Dehalococcoidia bacterium]|jgi:TRAP-type C4-dicarboxylate transport system permease large subunit